MNWPVHLGKQTWLVGNPHVHRKIRPLDGDSYHCLPRQKPVFCKDIHPLWSHRNLKTNNVSNWQLIPIVDPQIEHISMGTNQFPGPNPPGSGMVLLPLGQADGGHGSRGWRKLHGVRFRFLRIFRIMDIPKKCCSKRFKTLRFFC